MWAWLIVIGIVLVCGCVIAYGLAGVKRKGNGGKRVAIAGGAIGLAAAGFVAKCPEPTPGPLPPGPAPIPSPDNPVPPSPVPVTPMDQQVATLFDGTAPEAAALAGLADQMAASIDWDANAIDETGKPLPPVLKTTTDLGRVWARAQQYRMGSGTPFGPRFPALKNYLASEMSLRGIISATPAPMDATKRAAASQFFRDLGQAFGKKYLAMASPVKRQTYGSL